MAQPKIPFPHDVPTQQFRKPGARAEAKSAFWQASEGPSQMCFEVRFRNGEIRYFPYSDLRGCRLLHQGHLIIEILGMNKSHVIVEGRWLGDLARYLSLGCIDWLAEARGNRKLPEAESWIEKITIEDLTGP